MDPEYRKHYRQLFEKHWWWRARTELILEIVGRLGGRQQRILDVGCGEGLLFDRLSELGDVEGVDVSEAVPDDSKWRSRISVQPFDDAFTASKQYSIILMLDVLEHLLDPAVALRTARRLLAPDGFFLATVPAFQSLWTNHDVMNHHIKRYRRATLRPLMKAAGFDILEERYFYHWTCPIKLLMRGAEYMFRSSPKLPSIPAPWLNETLCTLSRIEQRSVTRLPMPFGSSLLVIARISDHSPHAH